MAGALAVAGGILMLFSGFTSRGLFLTILQFLGGAINGTSLPLSFGVAIEFAFQVLGILISLGGVTVILGGLALFLHRISTGRFLIALGGGTGFTGLAVAFVYRLVIDGAISVVVHGHYWLGLLLVVCARWIAGRA